MIAPKPLENRMPRQQSPDQHQYQKGVNPDNLITDEDDDAEDDEMQVDETSAPLENDIRLAQDPSTQRPDDNIDQAEDEDDDAEDDVDDVDDEDEDESDQISQRP
jgi:hypothetical protein